MSDKIGVSCGIGTATTIDKVKKEDYFRFPGQTKVRVRSDYDNSSRKYSYYDFDDVNKFGQRKKGTPVEIDFDF